MHKEFFYTNKNINEFTIALISDIHYSYPNYNINFFYKIITQLKNNKPNYICVCGDILDDSKYTQLEELKNFFNEIARIAPVIVVLGNHDNKTGNLWKWKELNNKELLTMFKHVKNLHLLNDSTFIDNNICFYGFNLSFHHYEVEDESYNSFTKETNELKTKLYNKYYNITLFHSPINIYNFIRNNPKHELNKTDLILSGHMHNGLLPFCITNFINKAFNSTRSLVAPSKTLFPKYAQGRVEDVKYGYVYEGVSKLSDSTKFFHTFNNLYKTNVEFITIKKDNN